jgi:glutathione synthase/RimK-type ligase-like ATP-grasp enzyme
LQERRIFSEYSAKPQTARNILILSAPGDWQANIPTDFLFDKARNNLHTYYLFDRLPDQTAIAQLPPFDLVFNAIAEPDKVRPNLLLADRFIVMANKPWLNDPKQVMKTTRDSVATILGQIEHCAIPAVRRAARQDLLGASRAQFLRSGGIRCPFLVRPAGAHAGDDLVKVESPEQVDRYLAKVSASEFYVTDFIDYKNTDDHYRKYRFIFVDGVPYPFHMAVSKNWMVHYYNADMGADAWKRAEESRFLTDYTTIFDVSLQRALGEISAAIGLDYFGIDCSITGDNRLLIFEVDVGMIVHLIDPLDLYPYKHQYVPRITRAFEDMIAARLAAA